MLPILRSFVKGPIQELVRLFRDKNYRSWAYLDTRYRFHPRFTSFTTKIHNYLFEVPDSLSFLSTYHEIFINNAYDFYTDKSNPFILDLGSNIGLSILYFKLIYPDSEIIGVEADPYIFQYLDNNILGNNFSNIELINKAAWHEETILDFSSEGADAGKISSATDGNTAQVKTFDCSDLLEDRSVDLLKIDIEGAEGTVLNSCRGQLSNVDNLIIEYHSTLHEDQILDEILKILRESGFRIHIHTVFSSPTPLKEVRTQYGYDNQLNIFASRKPFNLIKS